MSGGRPLKAVLAALLGLLTALPGAAFAFTPPAGCEGAFTIQSRGCLMTNAWTCEGDAPGTTWLALFDENGVRRVRQVDGEFQWVETWLFNPEAREVMEQPARDPASLTELFATQMDTYDFIVADDSGGRVRFEGFDRLTGETVNIDGTTWWRTEFGYTASDAATGRVLATTEGRQFVSREFRVFTFGLAWEATDPAVVFDNSPVEVILPGQPGFFPDSPVYDCGVVMSRLEEGQ